MERILVVDDDEINCEMASFILKSEYEVDTARSGIEALKKLDEKPCDLILLDIEMPVLDGFKTLERIRDNERTARIPVIFLTAKSSTQDVVRAAELGTKAFIRKPFLPNELISRVKEALKGASDEDRL